MFLVGCSKEVNINSLIENPIASEGTEKIFGEYFGASRPERS